MTTLYLYDANGYMSGVSDGFDAPGNSTPIAPPDAVNGVQPQFVNGTWQLPGTLPLLDALTFYVAFKVSERVAMRASTDPMVIEFIQTVDLFVSEKKKIDPNLSSTTEALAYLSANPISSPIIDASRIPQILAGMPQ